MMGEMVEEGREQEYVVSGWNPHFPHWHPGLTLHMVGTLSHTSMLPVALDTHCASQLT